MSGSRRSRKKTGTRSTPKAPRRRTGSSWRGLVVGALAIVVAAAALWALRPGSPNRREGTGSPSRSAEEYLRLAQAAESAQDYEAALTLFRESVRDYPREMVLLGSYASALNNRSFLVRSNRGRTFPLAPTSHERVANALASLAMFDAAERAQPQNGEPALQRGLLYAAWGLPEDALAELYRAHLLGGRQDEIDKAGSTITLLQLGHVDTLDQNGRPASR